MNTIEEKVAQFISNDILSGLSSVEVVVKSRLLEDGVLDSLGLQQLVTYLEEEFSLEIDDDIFTPENFESVQAISKFISASNS